MSSPATETVPTGNDDATTTEATTATATTSTKPVVDDEPPTTSPTAKTAATGAKRLLRRAFSMPRNPFRIATRKVLKVTTATTDSSAPATPTSPTIDELAAADTHTTNGGGAAHNCQSASSSSASSGGSYTRTTEVSPQLLSACRQQNGLAHKSATLQAGASMEMAAETADEQNGGKQRRSAWRKVILRLAHQMTSIGVSCSLCLCSAPVMHVCKC